MLTLAARSYDLLRFSAGLRSYAQSRIIRGMVEKYSYQEIMLRDDNALWNSRLCCEVVSEEQQKLPNLLLHAIFRIGEIVPDGPTDLSPQPPKSRSNVFPDRKSPSPSQCSIYFAPFRPVQTKNRPASLAVAGRSNSKMSLFLHANSPERLPLFRWLRALPGNIKELLSLRH